MKSILLLGATSDMAVATAHEFARRGYNIVLAARNISALHRIESDIQIRYKVEVKVLGFDALNYTEHQALVDGLNPLPEVTALFFGELGEHEAAIKDWSISQKILEVNFNGAASVLHHIANRYEAAKQGTIVGVSSVAGERGRQSNYIYGSAKAGFTAFLSGLRNRLYKSGVHVATIKPGFVATKMTDHLELPKLLTATPQQVAKAIYQAVRKSKDVVYVLPVWRLIMQNIRLIPEKVFKRMSL